MITLAAFAGFCVGFLSALALIWTLARIDPRR